MSDRIRTGTSLGAALVLAITILSSTSALAQSPRSGRAPKVVELEGLEIEGRIAKPQVFYILGRSSIRYENLSMDQSFVHRIIDAAKKNPF